MSDTLILAQTGEPQDFLPLSAISWQDCMRLYCLEKIIPIHLYEDRWIRSPKLAIQLPAVAITKEKFNFKKGKVRFSRSLLYIRDGYKCGYCGEIFPHKELSIDHIIPKCEGGKSTWINTICSCKNCNLRKGHQHWSPIFKPWVPDYYSLSAKRLEMPILVSHKSWIPYLRVGNKVASAIKFPSSIIADKAL
jgi:5-methylcytosine-specific restriction endonuclease McrA